MQLWMRSLSLFLLVLSLLACKDKYFTEVQYHKDGLVGRYAFDPDSDPQDSYYEFEYSFLGKPTRVVHRKNGVVSGDGSWAVALIDGTASGVEIRYSPTELSQYVSGRDIHRVEIENETNGTLKLRLFNPFGKSIDSSEDKVFLQAYSFTPEGRIAKQAFLDRAGKPVNSFTTGYHATLFEYDKEGRVVKRSFVDIDGKPAQLRDGTFHTERITYDGAGVETHIFNPDNDSPGVDSEGCQQTREKRHLGEIREILCLNAKGDLVEMKTQPGAYGIRKEYEKGKLKERIYLNQEGKAANTTAAIERRTYDEKGFLKEMAFYKGDSPSHDKNGVHRHVYSFDSSYRLLSSACFSIEGKPAACNKFADYHRDEYRYDQKGNMIEKQYFGVDGKPKDFNGLMATKEVITYNDMGLETGRALFGADDKPFAGSAMYHRTTISYDEKGNATELRFFGKEGEPVVNTREGYHMLRLDPGPLGQASKYEFFDAKEKPTRPKSEQCEKVTLEYDDIGNVSEIRYFNGEGKACTIEGTSIHMIKPIFDDRMQNTEQSLFDEKGQPAFIPQTSIHKFEYGYYPDGRQHFERVLKVDGTPAQNQAGVHRREWIYYPDGRVKEFRQINSTGQVIDTITY